MTDPLKGLDIASLGTQTEAIRRDRSENIPLEIAPHVLGFVVNTGRIQNILHNYWSFN